MKRIIGLILALVLVCSVLAGCGGGSGSTGSSGSGAAPSSGEGSGSVEIKIATVGNETHQSTIAAQFFKEKIEELSGGQITATIFPNGALGGEREAAEGVKLGTIQMTIVTTDGALPAWVPDVQVLSIPYLFTTKAEAYDILDNVLQQELAPQFEAQGFVHLGFAELGFRHFTNNVREVKSAEDMAGLSIRVQEAPIWFALTDMLGATATPVSFNELYTALQQGMVDGQENPITSIASSRFDEVQKYMVLDGHTYAAQSIVFNKTLFDSMSGEEQGWIQQAADYASENQRKVVSAQEEEYLEELRKTMTVTDPDIQSFIDATEGLYLRDDVQALVNPELVELVLEKLGR